MLVQFLNFTQKLPRTQFFLIIIHLRMMFLSFKSVFSVCFFAGQQNYHFNVVKANRRAEIHEFQLINARVARKNAGWENDCCY